MPKEDNIIVPRWFLESVEDTLRIQYNINQPDLKKNWGDLSRQKHTAVT